MRRLGGLFDELCSVENLRDAWRDFRRGKGGRPAVRRFEPRAEEVIEALHRELGNGSYRHGPYELLNVLEPKRRVVSAARIRDRVVHHAVHRVLAPRLDRRLIEQTYACLPGRGSHRAILRFISGLRHYRYVLMLDIRRYFLSIDRVILIELMGRQIKDDRVLALLRAIADSSDGMYRRPEVAAFLELEPGFPPEGCGLPIGNLTSQWWGNHYLSGFDHFAERALKVPHYQRYMDDLALFADSRAQLEESRESGRDWLRTERRLELKHPDVGIRDTGSRLTYLGYRVSRTGVRPSQELLARMQLRVGELALRGDPEVLKASIASYRGIWLFVAPGT